MSELKQIIDNLDRIHGGEAWHGPSLLQMLSEVTPEQAAAKPVGRAHSIWELILHIAGWEEVCRLRLEGRQTREPEEGDFPQPHEPTAGEWRKALDRLETTHQKLTELVRGLTDSELDQQAVGFDYNKRFLLHGILLHHVYHAGQIRLLQKSLQ